MEISRRSFLGGALALTAAASLPIPLRGIPLIHGDGIHDDSDGLQAAIDGKPFRCVGEKMAVRNAGGTIFINSGSYLLSHTLLIRSDTTIYGGHFQADDHLTGPVLHMRGGTMIGCYIEGGPHSTYGVLADGSSATLLGVYNEG